MKRKLAKRIGESVGRQLAHPAGAAGWLVSAAMRVANRRPTRALIQALDIHSHHRVLDIGCGDGSALASVSHAAWRSGIDRSDTMLAIASRKLRQGIRTGRVAIERGDMHHLPFSSVSFDRIIASNILYFCHDVPTFIEECRRVSRPGALLGIYVTAAESMAHWRFAGPATHRHFDRRQLEAELAAAAIGPAARSIIPIALPGGVEGLIAVIQLA